MGRALRTRAWDEAGAPEAPARNHGLPVRRGGGNVLATRGGQAALELRRVTLGGHYAGDYEVRRAARNLVGHHLGGGRGNEAPSLTRRVTGDERPKQFCPLLDGEMLVDRTRRRVTLTIEPDRTFVVVTGHQEAFYASALADVPPERLVVQPGSRGTAPAILYLVIDD